MMILFYPAPEAKPNNFAENNKSEDCLKSIWHCFQIAETSQRARGIATEAVRCESQTSICWKQEWLVWAKTYRSRGFFFFFFLFWRPFCPLLSLNKKKTTWKMRFSFYYSTTRLPNFREFHNIVLLISINLANLCLCHLRKIKLLLWFFLISDLGKLEGRKGKKRTKLSRPSS